MPSASSRECKTLPADRVIHIRYRELTGDPAGTVARLYTKFGLAFDAAFEQRIKAYVDEKPNGGYGQLRHRLEDYGIDAAREQHRFADYIETFDVWRPNGAAGGGRSGVKRRDRYGVKMPSGIDTISIRFSSPGFFLPMPALEM